MKSKLPTAIISLFIIITIAVICINSMFIVSHYYYGNSMIIFKEKADCNSLLPDGYSLAYNLNTKKYVVKLPNGEYLWSHDDGYDDSSLPFNQFSDSCRAKIFAWDGYNFFNKKEIENNFK